jgi:hypothetical protein
VFVSVFVSLLSLQGNGSVKCIPHFGARHRLGKHFPAAKSTRDNRRIFGLVIFCAVRVFSKESMWVSLCIPLSFLGNNSVKTFSRQSGTVGRLVFYADRVVSKERGRLFLKISCSNWSIWTGIKIYLQRVLWTHNAKLNTAPTRSFGNET